MDIPDYFDGIPLLPDCKAAKGKASVFGELQLRHIDGTIRAPYRIGIRTERYNLNLNWRNVDGEPEEEGERDGFLADLSKDPFERTNLFHHPQYREQIAKLEKQLHAYMAEEL